jgi:hypothetical protein
MARLVFAVVALLLAGQGCAAVEDTTTFAEERRLETTDVPSTSEPVSAAPRMGGLGPMLLALLALLLSGTGCTALDDTTTAAEERRLETTDGPSTSESEPVSAAPRASGLGPMIALGAALGLGARR